MNSEPNTKRTRILLFGESVFGNKIPDLSQLGDCEVKSYRFPEDYSKLSRLDTYELVILDYSAFVGGLLGPPQAAEVFQTMMLHALNNGTWFCFLHYRDMVPDPPSQSGELMDSMSFERCSDYQLGLRLLAERKIIPLKRSRPIPSTGTIRPEFHRYFKRWGSSANYFLARDMGHFENIICGYAAENISTGFALDSWRGKVLFLPCQRDFDRPEDIQECLSTLIRSLLSYKNSAAGFPEWANKPIFQEESELYGELDEAKTRVAELQTALEAYRLSKEIIFMREYDFQEQVPIFIQNRLGLKTTREEKFQEDFWIVDRDGKEIVIGETKSYDRDTKLDAVKSPDLHRSQRGYEDSFPAISVVTANLRASSWKEKRKPINHNVCKLAAERNIVLVRIEDLVFFEYWLKRGKRKPDELLEAIMNKSGWLEVTQDGKMEFHS